MMKLYLEFCLMILFALPTFQQQVRIDICGEFCLSVVVLDTDITLFENISFEFEWRDLLCMHQPSIHLR